MPAPSPNTLTLIPHPWTPSPAIRAITVRILRMRFGLLAMTYIIEGDLDHLQIPAPRPRCVTDKLWEHTCCEVFIARKNSPSYHEFNLAPSGEWAVYAFDRYRERATLDAVTPLDPQIAVRRHATTLELDAMLRLDALSPGHANTALSLAISTVIEHRDGSLSYWALKHPSGQPDFHHPDAFAATLDEIRT